MPEHIRRLLHSKILVNEEYLLQRLFFRCILSAWVIMDRAHTSLSQRTRLIGYALRNIVS